MLQLRVTTNIQALEQYLAQLEVAVDREGRVLASKAAAAHTGKMIRSFRGYTGPRNTGGQLQKRSGALRNAMRFTNESTGSSIQASSYVAGPIAYARIQELGGVVRPKRRRYLTIPTPAVLTAAGVVRQSAKPTEIGGRWYTNGKVPGLKLRETFIRRGKGGNPIIYGTGKDGNPVALWVLKKSVKIPPRLGFFRTWKEQETLRDKMIVAAGKRMLGGRPDVGGTIG